MHLSVYEHAYVYVFACVHVHVHVCVCVHIHVHVNECGNSFARVNLSVYGCLCFLAFEHLSVKSFCWGGPAYYPLNI